MRQQTSSALRTILSLTFWVFIAVLTPSLAAAQSASGGTETTGPASPEPSPADDTSTDTSRAVPDLVAQRQALLRAQYPQQDLQTLSAGDEQFSALWRLDSSGKALGSLLLLPAPGQTANWPNTVEILRTILPRYGWNTLAIDLQNPPSGEQVPPPAKDSDAEYPDAQAGVQDSAASDQSKSAASPSDTDNTMTSSVDDSEQKNLARVRAALDFLRGKGQQRSVIIAFGDSAALALKTDQASLRALILVDDKQPLLSERQADVDLNPLKNIPLLDLIASSHEGYYTDKALLSYQQRAATARDKGLQKFVQMRYNDNGVTYFNGENSLSRRIRGFLSKNVAGQ